MNKRKMLIISIIVIVLCATLVLALSYTKLGNVDVVGWLSMNDGNITGVNCMKFTSGGQICSGV